MNGYYFFSPHHKLPGRTHAAINDKTHLWGVFFITQFVSSFFGLRIEYDHTFCEKLNFGHEFGQLV
jgi:hypothetical protein